jgi:hypothetical protein
LRNLATCGISSIEKLHDHHECDGSREEEEEGDKHEPERLLIFFKAHAAYATYSVSARHTTWKNVCHQKSVFMLSSEHLAGFSMCGLTGFSLLQVVDH